MSLRLKVVSTFLVIILIFVLGIFFGIKGILIKNLRIEMNKRGILLAQDLAFRSLDLLLTENNLTLLEIFQESLKNDKDLKYIYILDPKRKAILHTFEEGFPSDLLKIDSLGALENYKIEILETEEGIIEDISVPLLKGKIGTLHIGLSEKKLRNFIFSLNARIIFIVLAISLLGIIIFFFLTKFIIYPLEELTQVAKKITSGNLNQRVKIKTKDELNFLGKAFNEMAETIQKKEEQSKNLLKKLISAQEEERKRISRELHDETNQNLAALNINLKLIENSSSLEEMKEKLSGARKGIVKTMDGIRLLTSSLRPPFLDELGLIEILKKDLKEFSDQFGINIDFQPLRFYKKTSSSYVEITLYRVIQEALANIVRHSGAKNVSLCLKYNQDKVFLVIEDDGKGFDQSLKKRKSFGILGMQERVSLIGGEFTLESQIGKGTGIFVKIPLKYETTETTE